MNERIKQLAEQAGLITLEPNGFDRTAIIAAEKRFAELIVQECRTVINDVYNKTPLELCGPLLTVDEEIMKHFYGVEE